MLSAFDDTIYMILFCLQLRTNRHLIWNLFVGRCFLLLAHVRQPLFVAVFAALAGSQAAFIWALHLLYEVIQGHPCNLCLFHAGLMPCTDPTLKRPCTGELS